ncbi:hypothetical protein NQZ68_040166 [Dissostichus eleginoides]|nr:hypothetical protein NQZ68_040166 [Dissostichus eleginoides]
MNALFTARSPRTVPQCNREDASSLYHCVIPKGLERIELDKTRNFCCYHPAEPFIVKALKLPLKVHV